jgi:hypothetical protein
VHPPAGAGAGGPRRLPHFISYYDDDDDDDDDDDEQNNLVVVDDDDHEADDDNVSWQVTDELVECILRPGLEPGALDVFLDFISYSGQSGARTKRQEIRLLSATRQACDAVHLVSA